MEKGFGENAKLSLVAGLATLALILASTAILAADVGKTSLPVPPAITPPSVSPTSLIKKTGIAKLSPFLNQAYNTRHRTGPIQDPSTMGSMITGGSLVKIAVECKPGKAGIVASLVESLGGVLDSTYRDLVFATFPIDKLPSLASSNDLRWVRTPYRKDPEAVTEGAAIHGAVDAHAKGFIGQGTKVGVLDCGGFSGYSSLLGTDLPAGVTVWNGGESGDPVGSDIHGAACAEIVYDMAPGAAMYLAYDATEADYYNAIDWLVAQGVDIISYSCGWTGPYPNDGAGLPYNPVNEKASEARANGVLFVSSAGNNAWNDNYQAFFSDDGSGFHYFGSGFTWVNPVYIYTSGAYITLTWNDWPADPTASGSTQDYDLLLFDGTVTLVASSVNTQNGTIGQIPFEEIYFEPPADGWYYLAILKWNATGDQFLNLRKSQSGSFYYHNAETSIGVPGESPNVLAAGAIFWNGLALESFSSRGPTLGPGGAPSGGYLKPDLVAADGVSTESYGLSDGLDWESFGTGFFGTSASCPHAAGAAAVVLSMRPGYSADALENVLLSSAVDMGAQGPDNEYGYGRILIEVVQAIPALSEYGILLFSLFAAGIGAWLLRKRRRAAES
jgi:hypothetical protein